MLDRLKDNPGDNAITVVCRRALCTLLGRFGAVAMAAYGRDIPFVMVRAPIPTTSGSMDIDAGKGVWYIDRY